MNPNTGLGKLHMTDDENDVLVEALQMYMRGARARMEEAYTYEERGEISRREYHATSLYARAMSGDFARIWCGPDGKLARRERERKSQR